MAEPILLAILRRLPRNALSRAVGLAAHARVPRPLARVSVRTFAWACSVDLAEAEKPVADYRSVGELFTRRLRPGARAIDRRPGFAVSPADGRLLNAGRLVEGALLQAKGVSYRVADLLADQDAARRFGQGSWATIYLSPTNYHRVHHPVEGCITGARYVGGSLWPVNQVGVENLAGLFCLNERVVTFVDSPIGEVAVVMVGATSVGHITSTYDPDLQSNWGHTPGHRAYDTPIRVARGDELGAFHLGSTVIVLFADPAVEPLITDPDQPVRVGQAIARKGEGT